MATRRVKTTEKWEALDWARSQVDRVRDAMSGDPLDAVAWKLRVSTLRAMLLDLEREIGE